MVVPREPCGLQCRLAAGALTVLGAAYTSLGMAFPDLFPGFAVWNLRIGALTSHWPLEELLSQYRVDLVMSGHTHVYERSKPVFREKVRPSGKAPVYVVGGNPTYPTTAGFRDDMVPSWNAFRDEEARFSYGVVRIPSRHRLVYEQVEARGLDVNWDEGSEMKPGDPKWATSESPPLLIDPDQVTNTPLHGPHRGQSIKRRVIDRFVLEKP